MRNQYWIGSIILTLSLSIVSPAMAGGVIKEVCRKELKNNKPVQVCKKIKVHKKLEGTPVPKKTVKK